MTTTSVAPHRIDEAGVDGGPPATALTCVCGWRTSVPSSLLRDVLDAWGEHVQRPEVAI